MRIFRRFWRNSWMSECIQRHATESMETKPKSRIKEEIEETEVGVRWQIPSFLCLRESLLSVVLQIANLSFSFCSALLKDTERESCILITQTKISLFFGSKRTRNLIALLNFFLKKFIMGLKELPTRLSKHSLQFSFLSSNLNDCQNLYFVTLKTNL